MSEPKRGRGTQEPEPPAEPRPTEDPAAPDERPSGEAAAEAEAAGGGAPGEPPEEEGAEERLARAEREAAELRERLLYLQAEQDNYKKRTEKRVRETLEFAAEPVLRELLPVLDNLERALDHSRQAGPEGHDALLEGLEHVIAQFHDVLGRHGVEPVPGAGERFDPHVHEAMVQVPGDENGKVGDVYEKGYLLKGRLLRPAKVSVTKVAPPDTDD